MIPAFVPHGLLYIASYAIKQGYKVAIFDRNVEFKEIKEVLEETKPKVIGLGCLTGKPIDDAIYISKESKRIDPAI